MASLIHDIQIEKKQQSGCCRHHSNKWVVEKVLCFPHINVLNINITIRKIRKFNIYYIKSKFNQVKNVEVMTKSHNKCCVLGDEDWENGQILRKSLHTAFHYQCSQFHLIRIKTAKTVSAKWIQLDGYKMAPWTHQKRHFKNLALRDELNLYNLMFFIFLLLH